MSPVYIIAEAGVNHNGSLERACQMVDVAVKAGADAIKFQSFKADKLVIPMAQKAEYQRRNQADGKTQLQMLKALELSEAQQQQLFNYCQQQHIHFLSSPFDPQSCAFLIKQLALKTIKLGSGELTNAQLLIQLSQAHINVILSTGMSTLEEIRQALSILAYGYTHPAIPRSSAEFLTAWQSQKGQAQLRQHVTLMHCTTEYPCPVNEVNLSAIKTIQTEFSLPCGYSDHTQGIHISIAAAALGAPVIEKHFTLDRALPGPDHRASIEPDELYHLVKQIRDIEQSMGDAIKQVTLTESRNKAIARKGVYAANTIKKGQLLTEQNLVLKRPVCQHQAFEYWDLINTLASKDYTADDAI